MLNNLENYGVYADFVQQKDFVISVDEITKDNVYTHIENIKNIIRDSIESPDKKKIGVMFNNGKVIRLTLPDYFVNLVFWYSILRCGDKIRPKHLLLVQEFTGNTIKNYFDKFVITPHKKNIDIVELNNIIADTLYFFNFVDEFSFYFSNSVNLQDDIAMMNAIPEYRELMHGDFTKYNFSELGDRRAEATNKIVDYIKQSKQYIGHDHIYTNPFRAKELINIKQLTEFMVAIGAKPDGDGGIIPYTINNSFLNGGVDDTISYFIDSYAGRLAQIMAKKNVSKSGDFARCLGLNNQETHLYPDPDYVCDTKNFLKVTINSKDMFKIYIGRYYRETEDGFERELTDDDYDLVAGKTLLFRSPITCASHARGEGVCYRCYGSLAYINKLINIGKYAADTTSSVFTQRLLSAKHLLAVKISKINWPPAFYDAFTIDSNEIKVKTNMTKNMALLIKPSDIGYKNENDIIDDEDYDFVADFSNNNEYVESLVLKDLDTCETTEIDIDDIDEFYLEKPILDYVKRHCDKDDDSIDVEIPLNDKRFVGETVMNVEIKNNDLGAAMNAAMKIIDRNNVTGKFSDYNEITNVYTTSLIKGGLNVPAVHSEVLISNQVKDANSILRRPDWTVKNPPHVICTLSRALTDNESITISLSYKRLSAMFKSALTFKKNKSSSMDYFFMEHPQEFIKRKFEVFDDSKKKIKRAAFKFVTNHNDETK